MAIELPPLPYDLSALEPHISRETLEYHYGKHHKAYVTKANKLLEDNPLKGRPLEEIIKAAEPGSPIFNNTAQVWNHTFYWNCLSPKGGAEPKGELGKDIAKEFGSFAEFKELFTKIALDTFGSGWAWLAKCPIHGIEIISTSNAETPLTNHKTPLLTCDVWEHAYYIDYRNERPKYLEAFWNLVNWDFVEKNLG